MPNPSSSPEVHCPLAIGGAVRSVHGHAKPAEEHRLQQPPEPKGVQRRVQQAPDDVVVAHVVPVVGAVGGRRVQQAQPLRPPHGPRVSVLPGMGPGVRQVGQRAPEEGRGAEVSVGPERPPQGKDGGPGLPQTLSKHKVCGQLQESRWMFMMVWGIRGHEGTGFVEPLPLYDICFEVFEVGVYEPVPESGVHISKYIAQNNMAETGP
mmetsp:Transcript_10892/g.17043  ORF Transcript_10892/g.17043 Transcript_10892/m.17043 type:complete len:207 (-) Transcript_10892:65-685(-)